MDEIGKAVKYDTDVSSCIRRKRQEAEEESEVVQRKEEK